jgi:4-hydroxythreonine-4-phosphate dehydrogenase
MSARTRVRVGVTMGDPAGIGPEIVLKAITDPRVRAVCEPVLYGPRTAAERKRFTPGVLSADAGRAACEAIEQAVADAMAGRLDAIATGPIHKEALALAGVAWRGHTELLAHLTGARDVAMMFDSPRLRVVLVTVHVPLSSVPRLLTQARVETTLALAAEALPRFGVPTPRLALAGLNPHAGEGGLMGSEDQDVLVPAVESARRRGIDVTGPLPADTVFRQAVDGRFDAVIACYHDQGLIPVKLVGFGEAVNITLGLPIVRTSVDHGTAFDIAGRGVADETSLVHAVVLAARLARGEAVRATEGGVTGVAGTKGGR